MGYHLNTEITVHSLSRKAFVAFHVVVHMKSDRNCVTNKKAISSNPGLFLTSARVADRGV